VPFPYPFFNGGFMKKFCVVLLAGLTLGIVKPANAQIRMGFVGGLNFSEVSSNADDAVLSIATSFFSDEIELGLKLNSRTLFGLGGVLDLPVAKDVVLRLEPLYLQKGSKAKIISGEKLADYTITFLEIPAFIKYEFGTGVVRPSFLAGPTLGLVLSAKGFDFNEGDSEIDWTDFTKSPEFGLAFGGGLNFLAGANVIFVEARYAFGLNNIFDSKAFENRLEREFEEAIGEDVVVKLEEIEIKTRGFHIMVGITFPLGAK
jgi:hypothetical protein